MSMTLTELQKTEILKFYGLEKYAKVPVKVDDFKDNRHNLYDPTFNQNWLERLPYPNTGKDSAFINLHGGGEKGHYALGNNQSGADNEMIMEQWPFKYVPVNGEGTSIGQNSVGEGIDKLNKDHLHKVFSIACNHDGGGRPEFYDKLLGGDVNEAILTPPGYVGISGQGMTNIGEKIYNWAAKNDPDAHMPEASPQHIYDKIHSGLTSGDSWVDKGEYTPPLDDFYNHHWAQGVGGLAGLTGMSALVYGLYNRKKNKNKLDAIHKKVTHAKH